jgi:hypothetical protein
MLLVYPPVAKSCEPPAGIARLAGVLRGHDIPCDVIDCNLEGMYYLLKMAKEPKDTWGKRAYKNQEENLDAIRNLKIYQNVDGYKRAVTELNRIIGMVGQDYGLKLSLVNYHDPNSSPIQSDDLIESATFPERNIFYPYFSDRLISIIESRQPEMIGFSLNYLSQAACTFAMAGFVKKMYPNLPIVIGGGLITSWMRNPIWENPFTEIVDHFVAGPGEDSLLALLNKENEGKALPPCYGDFPLAGYLSPGFILPYAASYGCYWNKCSFCPEKAEGNSYVTLPSHFVGNEIRDLKSQYSPSLLHFLDNAISPSLMRYMIKNPPGFNWYGFARVNSDLEDEEFCVSLRGSGCVMLKLGLESGDQGVLDKMEKGINLEMVAKSLRALKKAGIATYVYLLFGTPAESLVEARHTMDFVIKHHNEISFLNLAVFNMPINSSECLGLDVNSFYDGDLSLYTDFLHPQGWNRKEVRHFLDKEFKRNSLVSSIINRDPPFFTSNHAPFFCNMDDSV